MSWRHADRSVTDSSTVAPREDSNWKPVSNSEAEVPALPTNRVALQEALISGRPLVLVDAKTGSRIATRVVTVFDKSEQTA
jgi:hypothetical protein